ncbi:MAG TPA: transposase [Candidatus Dormibacteraeota bacterium]|nr:transposase [Candidatus Dormibacteraeota bacterium]
MLGEHPIKQILIDTRDDWDHTSTPSHIRENFLKIIQCRTMALGAEVYASETESKLVYHTCKSRYCTSCGQRATEAWQEDLAATLPDVPYVGITLTMPKELRPILQANPHVLHSVPTMGAEALKLWAKARHGARIIVIVVQQTFGGLLNFVPHLHVLVSQGGLQESRRWIDRLGYDRKEIMQAWRYAVLALISESRRTNPLKVDLSCEELTAMLQSQWKRRWNIFISRPGSKVGFLRHDGRYIRRPPVAQHRLRRTGEDEVEYWVKDTRAEEFVRKLYTLNEFVTILMRHVPHRGRHAMRYFGLLAPRCKAQAWGAIFLVLKQVQRPRPARTSWRWLLHRTFGIDPLLDSTGRPMRWIGRRNPVRGLGSADQCLPIDR